MPSIAFDVAGAEQDLRQASSWKCIIQRNVLGPFAPRSGWIGQCAKVKKQQECASKPELPVTKKRESGLPSNIKNKAIRLKMLAMQQEAEKAMKERKQSETLPMPQSQRPNKNNPCFIYCGSKVLHRQQ